MSRPSPIALGILCGLVMAGCLDPASDTVPDVIVEPDSDGEDDSDTGEDPDTDEDSDSSGANTRCAEGTDLTPVDPVPGFALYGSVFSLTPYIPGDAATDQPEPVRVRLTRSGEPVAGCIVDWSADEAGTSWAYPMSEATDADGIAAAWWVAADAPGPILRASIPDGPSVTVQGQAMAGTDTRTASMWLHYDVPAYEAIRVQVTPITEEPTTYYSVLNWPGAYAGIQFERTDLVQVSCGGHFAATCGGCPQGNGAAWCNGDCAWVDGSCVLGPDTVPRATKVIFSTWDRDDIADGDATLVHAGAANATTGFGGEGTGVSARLLLPPSVHGTIAGLPDDYNLVAGDTYAFELSVTQPSDCADCSDYTVSFTDLTHGYGPIALGTQRYQSDATPSWAASFVEDWLSAPADSCVNAGTRTARFHDVEVRTGSGDWTPIDRASVDAIYLPSNNEVCANYAYRVQDDGFVISAGGVNDVSPPLRDDDAVWLELP